MFVLLLEYVLISLSKLVILLAYSSKWEMKCVYCNRAFYVWSYGEVPFNNWLHRGKKILIITFDRISDAKINHQMNISSNTTLARMSTKYSFEAKLCMRHWWSSVVQGLWLTVLRQLCKCLTHCWHSLSTRPPAATRKLPGRASTAAMALPAVSANSVGYWSCAKRFTPLPPGHTTFHFRCCSAVLCLCVCAPWFLL